MSTARARKKPRCGVDVYRRHYAPDTVLESLVAPLPGRIEGVLKAPDAGHAISILPYNFPVTSCAGVVL